MSPPSTSSSSSLSSMLTLLLTHPYEFRTLLQFHLYHEQKRDIKAQEEHPTSGWDRESMRTCWTFLDMTSRSFSAVIKELEGDLARTICLFYLVLRGLDTIEDDMTLPDEIKQPILRSFHEKTVTPGWKFEGCGPDEKDRQLLVEYDVVVQEVNLLLPEYKEIILDITQKMGTGMADYAHKASSTGSIYIESVSEYDLYCHYVAGLVGEGVSRIFSATKKEASWLGAQLELSNSMGLMLQKTNIIRDYREDTEERRFFWPREIWGSALYGSFREMRELCQEGNEERAGWVQSGMIVDGLRHATDALDYLRLLKNQSVFNFCAIPATMAMATMSLCFGNREMFVRNVKIRKAEAASLIMRSTNPREVAYIFRDYCRSIHARALPTDPNFLRISAACGKVEVWCEQAYPSFIQLSYQGEKATQKLNPSDPRSRIVQADTTYDEDFRVRRRVIEFKQRLVKEGKIPASSLLTNGSSSSGNGAVNGGEVSDEKAREMMETTEGIPWDIVAYAGAAMLAIVGTVLVLVLGLVRWADGEPIVPLWVQDVVRGLVGPVVGLVRS